MGEKQKLAQTSIGASFILMLLKLVFGILTGSLALLSDGIHSALDVTASLITWLALRISDRPADAEHNYGHGKVESLSAFGESILMFLAACGIGWDAVDSLLHSAPPPRVSSWALAVVAAAIAIDLWRSRRMAGAAKRYASPALHADALHFSTDMLISCVVLVSLLGVRLGGAAWSMLDRIGALIVVAVMIGVAFSLARKAVDVLMDRAPVGSDAALMDRIQVVPGVRGVLRIRVRQSGPQRFLDATIAVDPWISMQAGHRIATRVEHAVRDHDPGVDLTVHVEPAATGDPAGRA